jgi:hypothetical protein
LNFNLKSKAPLLFTAIGIIAGFCLGFFVLGPLCINDRNALTKKPASTAITQVAEKVVENPETIDLFDFSPPVLRFGLPNWLNIYETEGGEKSKVVGLISFSLTDNLSSADLEDRLINTVNTGQYKILAIRTWRISKNSPNKGNLTRYDIYYLNSESFTDDAGNLLVMAGNDLRMMVLRNNQKVPDVFAKVLDLKNDYFEVEGDGIRPKLLEVEPVNLSAKKDSYKILYYLKK